MNKTDRFWVKTMDWCSKYWGCHQLAERSFFIYGYQFPVCARCTGIIVGYIASLIYAICFKQIGFILAVLFMLPMIFDGLLQLFTTYLSNNTKRFITGFVSGFGFIQIIKCIVLFIAK